MKHAVLAGTLVFLAITIPLMMWEVEEASRTPAATSMWVLTDAMLSIVDWQHPPVSRIALAYNSNLDLIVPASSLLPIHTPIHTQPDDGDDDNTNDNTNTNTNDNDNNNDNDNDNKTNANVDVDVDADEDCDGPYTTPRQLVQCFQTFAKDGRGVERQVGDQEMYLKLVRDAEESGMGVHEVGGNAALMAKAVVEAYAARNPHASLVTLRIQAVAKAILPTSVLDLYAGVWEVVGYGWEGMMRMVRGGAGDGGVVVLLGGPVGEKLGALLPGSDVVMRASESSGEESDEVHLIVEYKGGEEIVGVTPPRANRFILHADVVNQKMETAQAFHDALPSFAPQRIVLSGFHLLDGVADLSAATRVVTTVLSSLQSTLAHMAKEEKGPPPPVVHLELASMANMEFLSALMQQSLPVADSIGFNEQELDGLVRAMGLPLDLPLFGDHPGAHNAPNLDAVLSALGLLLEAGPHVSRLHFHALAYHTVCTRNNSGWGPPSVPAAAGAVAVGLRACQIPLPMLAQHVVDPVSAFSLLANVTSDPTQPIRIDHVGSDVVCATAPVLVCNSPSRTVGLGDSISAVGLLYHDHQ